MALTEQNQLSQPPNKENIIQQIQDNLPQSLLVQPIWIAYYYKKNANGTYSKPPCSTKGHTIKENSLGVTFEQACRDGYPGIKINTLSPFIAFDIDDKDAKLGKRPFSITNLSPQFQQFMMTYDSYAEMSPSKCGIRILMQCKDKKSLPGRSNLSSELCIGGELFMNSGYVTITGDQIAGTEISEIPASALLDWLQPSNDKTNVIDMPLDQVRLPLLQDMISALKACKLDQQDRVKRAYKTVMGQDYNHYDYWLKVMAACHHYATVTNQLNEVVTAVVEWSATDPESYESEDDVLTHWISFSSKPQGITFHTLFKFANLLRFQWPQESYDKQGNPTGKPMINSVENFSYMMEYFNLEFFQDIFNTNMYVKGDKDIIDKYFLDSFGKRIIFGMAGPFNLGELKNISWQLAQNNHYTNVTFSTISPLFNVYAQSHTKEINMLKLWLETSYDELPEDMKEPDTDTSKSNLNYLLSCIKFNGAQNMQLAQIYFNTFFCEMMMPIYNTKRLYSQRSFMLVMTGPEACRKTTFFSMLFPANLRSQLVVNSTETLDGAKSRRDFATSLMTSALVVTDEFEIFYNKKNDSLFKTFVTSDVVDYVPIYEKTMKKGHRNAVLAGTTNKRSLAFEQDNNRRLAMIDVNFIDTSAMECINWHHFYQKYVAKGIAAMRVNKYPWKLSMDTIKIQYEVNEQFRAQSNLEIILYDLFDFEMSSHSKALDYGDIKSIQTDQRLFKRQDIVGIIKQSNPTLNVKPAALTHLLKRLCGKYTSTTNKTLRLARCSGSISNGLLEQGQHKRYLMPPRLNDFS